MRITKHRVDCPPTKPYWHYEIFGGSGSFWKADDGTRYLHLYSRRHKIWYHLTKFWNRFEVSIQVIGHDHRSLGYDFFGSGPTMAAAIRDVRTQIQAYRGKHKDVKAFVARTKQPRPERANLGGTLSAPRKKT